MIDAYITTPHGTKFFTKLPAAPSRGDTITTKDNGTDASEHWYVRRIRWVLAYDLYVQHGFDIDTMTIDRGKANFMFLEIHCDTPSIFGPDD